jgi:hypothetical protein
MKDAELTPQELAVIVLSWLGSVVLAGLAVMLFWEIIRST